MLMFNKFPQIGDEMEFIGKALQSNKISGGGDFAVKCENWFVDRLGCQKALLVPSCTAALEMAAILLDIQPGDEVILPSYTFVSTANAFVLRGANIVYVDVRKDTMNIDESLVEDAISERTKAIVVVHYAGVACEMDAIMAIAEKHGVYVVEDAAQAMLSTYKGRPLGAIGHLGAFSFHETKNYTSGGEGGLLIINDGKFTINAEIIREKGTNRSMFFRGQVDKYTWVNIGSSYLPSEIQAAYLWSQLIHADQINDARNFAWQFYYEKLKPLEAIGLIELPNVPEGCIHNAHMFYIKLDNLEMRTKFIEYMSQRGVMVVFHYVPLHSSPAGKLYGSFHGCDVFTTKESERLVRLPIFYGISESDLNKVVSGIQSFFDVEVKE
ncbi:dTDP-4-amino-4,6-dideoxygalactose transaminase [Alteromonas sp. CYL-A6]|uniref:dTDP-4-amino-4,6-dideoxygalactose transaminase n=1 Tax=Alteromonas nitratireducens TaxID=3390813 RepID=UPI0034A88622